MAAILILLALAAGIGSLFDRAEAPPGPAATSADEQRRAASAHRTSTQVRRDAPEGLRDAAPAADGAVPSTATCEIHGVVADTYGNGVGGIDVVARHEQRRHEQARTVSDAQGRFRLAALAPGDWLVAPMLEPASAVGDLVGPRAEHAFGAEAVAHSGARLAPRVTLSSDEPIGTVSLTLWRSSCVVGHLSASGAPVAGAMLRLSLMPWQIVVDTHSDAAGRFELRGLVPGAQRLSIWLTHSSVAGSHSPPVPRRLEIPEGTIVDLGELPCPIAERRITGRVIDEEGAPIEGLRVDCHPRGSDLAGTLAHCETDAHGEFELQGVPAIEVLVQIASADGLGGRPRVLESFPPPIDVDLRDGRDLRLDTVRATRRRPFVLDVHLTSSRGATDRLAPSGLHAWIVPGTRSLAEIERLQEDPERASALTQLVVRTVATGVGRLTWTVDRDFAPVTLVIRSFSRNRPVEIIEHVQPVRGQTRELRLGY